jgi:hypothetical protein
MSGLPYIWDMRVDANLSPIVEATLTSGFGQV